VHSYKDESGGGEGLQEEIEGRMIGEELDGKGEV